MGAPHEARYSRSARVLHRLAFASPAAQRGLADLEDRLFAGRLAAVTVERPVFLTGVPRAGTTLLLELLNALPSFVSHTYRDLPFLFAPLLQDALTRKFRRPGAAFPRAHGDGMTVGLDSPEAFEEVFWRAFWPERYRGGRIEPWTADDAEARPEFGRFLARHLRKLAALRALPPTLPPTLPRTLPPTLPPETAGRPRRARYLSKNHANLARLPLLARLFPDAALLVPFREPLAQTASLLRAHLAFERIHAAEPFSRRYMRDLGHYEFGANLKPLTFGGRRPPRRSPRKGANGPDGAPDPPAARRRLREEARSPDYWLRYWRDAYAEALRGPADRIAFSDYDRCCAASGPALRRLADRLGIPAPEADRLAAAGLRFRSPNPCPDDFAARASPSLVGEARAIHRELLSRSVT